MSQRLLDTALDYFPSKAQRSMRAFEGWRAHIDMLRAYLRALPESDLLGTYTEAQGRIQGARFHEWGSATFWFFSHASYEVFKEFLADDGICRSFADLLEYRAESRRAGPRRLLRSFAHLKKEMGNEAVYLAERYAELIKRHAHGMFGYFSLKKNRLIRLIPYPELSEDEYRVIFERECLIRWDVERNVRQAKIDHLWWKFERSRHASIARIFDPDPHYRLDKPDLRQLHESEVMLTADARGFLFAEKSDWKPISAIDTALRKFTRIGGWPKFTISEAGHDLKPIGISKFSCVWDEDALSGLVQNMLDLVGRPDEGAYREIFKTRHGLLPIGLKIHVVDTQYPYVLEYLKKGYFSAHNAGTCFNVPPLGNMQAVEEFFEIIRSRSGVCFLNNPAYQIQVCSIGKLLPSYAAMLGVCFYLGSDPIRRYDRNDFCTSHTHSTGNRLVIYGAGNVEWDFEWWTKGPSDEPVVQQLLPFKLGDRTDVLSCISLSDIRNVNLVATLLVHAQYKGYWSALGERFIHELRDIVNAHGLSSVLEAPWVHDSQHDIGEGDNAFFRALDELTVYAFEEVERIRKAVESGDVSAVSTGILYEIQQLLKKYATEIVEIDQL